MAVALRLLQDEQTSDENTPPRKVKVSSMNKRIVSAALAIAMSAIAAPTLLAAPVSFPGVHAKFGTKMITVVVRNDGKDSLTLKAGEQQIVIAPGQTAKFKVIDGTALTTVNATASHAAGDSIGTANSSLSGATLIIN